MEAVMGGGVDMTPDTVKPELVERKAVSLG
jgi:hypothetical protein